MSAADARSVFVSGGLCTRVVDRLGDVDLDPFKSGNQRLLLVVDTRKVMDDPLAHYVFGAALPGRGHLALVNQQLPELVSDLLSGAASAADWLRQGCSVTLVVVAPVPHALVTACVLVATGLRPPAALASVVEQLPDADFDLDTEIAVSVFEVANRPAAISEGAAHVIEPERPRCRRQ